MLLSVLIIVHFYGWVVFPCIDRYTKIRLTLPKLDIWVASSLCLIKLKMPGAQLLPSSEGGASSERTLGTMAAPAARGWGWALQRWHLAWWLCSEQFPNKFLEISYPGKMAFTHMRCLLRTLFQRQGDSCASRSTLGLISAGSAAV